MIMLAHNNYFLLLSSIANNNMGGPGRVIVRIKKALLDWQATTSSSSQPAVAIY
jgi:hypothetical protein